MPALVPLRVAYRVIDPNTGAPVAGASGQTASPLPHLHASSGTQRALQTGYPGSATLGSFNVKLPAPYTDDGKRYNDLFLALAPGQRIEGYFGDAIVGVPRFSGVITKIDQPLDGPWTLQCQDTLYWLQQSQVLPGEVIQPGTFASQIFQEYMGTQEVVWDDDFSGWNGSSHPNSSDYLTSGFSFVSSDPNLGLPALTATAAANDYALPSTSWNLPSQYAACAISIHGTLNVGSNASFGGDASIYVLSDSTAQNGVLAGAFCRQTSTPGTVVDGRIYTESAGTFTLQQQAANLFGALGNSLLEFEVTVVLYSIQGPGTLMRLLINGNDTGLQYPLGGTSGRIGVRFNPSPGGSPQIWCNRIQFHARTGDLAYTPHWGTNRFGAANVSVNNRFICNAINLNGQTHLDMLLLAAGLDGFSIRKNPGAGPKGDSLDYAVSPGNDLSTSIRFEEGRNVVSRGTTVGPVAEVFATDVKMNAIPGADSGGSVTWGRIGAPGDMVLTDMASDLGVPGYSLLVNYAQTVQGRKVKPQQAIQVAVLRTADTADLWRELDFVLVDIPTLGIFRQRVQVVGYTWDEATTTQTVYLSQLPATPEVPLQRIVRPIDMLTNGWKPR